MHKFTHIGAFYHVARHLETMRADSDFPERDLETMRADWDFPERYLVTTPVRYRGTVKLHEANSGVHCTAGALIAQSRTREIAPGDDNYGFAAFVAQEQRNERFEPSKDAFAPSTGSIPPRRSSSLANGSVRVFKRESPSRPFQKSSGSSSPFDSSPAKRTDTLTRSRRLGTSSRMRSSRLCPMVRTPDSNSVRRWFESTVSNQQ